MASANPPGSSTGSPRDEDRAEVTGSDGGGERAPTGALLAVEHLVKHFPVRAGILGRRRGDTVHAVDDVSFAVREGETLGIVGESGCGKSTLGRLLVRLLEPTAGSVRFGGKDLASLKGSALRSARRSLQMVFQDPASSLNPRMQVGHIVTEPLVVHGLVGRRERDDEARRLLAKVGLKPEHAGRYPHEFSGGQKQRIGIARALALKPRFLVLDEPTSALDVSVQAQILNLLRDLQREEHLTYVFVTHALNVVQHIADRVAVMYLGRIVEEGPTAEVFASPRHPYTRALLSAVPDPTRRARERTVLAGDLPSPLNPPQGCRFHTRCPIARPACKVGGFAFRERVASLPALQMERAKAALGDPAMWEVDGSGVRFPARPAGMGPLRKILPELLIREAADARRAWWTIREEGPAARVEFEPAVSTLERAACIFPMAPEARVPVARVVPVQGGGALHRRFAPPPRPSGNPSAEETAVEWPEDAVVGGGSP